jgi:H+/Cl- antiporter ClcA
MPAITAAAVWATRKWAPGASGSGIPQVIATLEPSVDASLRKRFVSLWLSFAKIVLSSAGFLAGLSIGREGPSVQVAAGVMHSARRWLGPKSVINTHALLVAGGAAVLPQPSTPRWRAWCLPSRSSRASWSRAPAGSSSRPLCWPV